MFPSIILAGHCVFFCVLFCFDEDDDDNEAEKYALNHSFFFTLSWPVTVVFVCLLLIVCRWIFYQNVQFLMWSA